MVRLKEQCIIMKRLISSALLGVLFVGSGLFASAAAGPARVVGMVEYSHLDLREMRAMITSAKTSIHAVKGYIASRNIEGFLASARTHIPTGSHAEHDAKRRVTLVSIGFDAAGMELIRSNKHAVYFVADKMLRFMIAKVQEFPAISPAVEEKIQAVITFLCEFTHRLIADYRRAIDDDQREAAGRLEAERLEEVRRTEAVRVEEARRTEARLAAERMIQLSKDLADATLKNKELADAVLKSMEKRHMWFVVNGEPMYCSPYEARRRAASTPQPSSPSPLIARLSPRPTSA